MPSDKLTRQQVEFVLRRAAEIDTHRPASAEHGQGNDPDDGQDGLTVTDLLKLGEEAGLRGGAVSQALTELRRGVSIEPEERGVVAQALGASRIIVSRVVPAPVDMVRRAVDRFLREQLMTVRRHHGARIEWERAQGIWPGLVRSLDFSKRYAFSLVSRVETVVAEERSGDLDAPDTSVTFNIDLADMRRERLTQMGLRSAMAFAIVGLGGAAMFPGFGVPDLVALASGGVAAGGIFALDRKRYLESRSRVALAPERFLDLLTQRQANRRGPRPTEDEP
ncbi:MAG TPA: hypothetical protein VHL80_00730 [Polyangia bacterium]|nr:hypothetical protein [Polyangia bacterium]